MKYIIESNDVIGYTPKYVMLFGDGDGYTIQPLEDLDELDSDYINEHYGSLQDEAYQRGLDAAWEAARKIVLSVDEGGLSVQNLSKIFGTDASRYALKKYSASEAIEKLKAYEEQKADDEIKVGDEVIYNEHRFIMFATETEEHYASLFDVNGRHASASQKECKKTGRHFDIDKILGVMKE